MIRAWLPLIVWPTIVVHTRSVRCDAGFLDHLCPAQAILDDRLRQPLWRTSLGRHALVPENGLNGRLRQYLVEQRILAINDLLWRTGGSKGSEPQIDVEIDHAQFNERWNLLGLLCAHFAANGKNTYLPAPARGSVV